MILTVPRDDEEALFPTLGPQVCDFIEQNMVFGPGDLLGQPVVLDTEWAALIYRIYEVNPKGHPQAGRRRFKRVGLSLPKGLAKTEKAAMLAICELHPEAPVRCVGWTDDGEPIGGPVTDPYIPLVATSQEQSDELCFTAMRKIIEHSPTLRDDFIVGLERIERKKGDGKAEALSSNPNSRDGARTTFSVMDETHRLVLPRQKHSHTVMLTNLPKRKGADGWMLEVTTAPEPGAGSVAEGTMEYAKSIANGSVTNAAFFFFHRQAGDEHDLSTREGRIAAITEASGPAAEWRDIEGIAGLWDDPGADTPYLERVYLNRLVRGSTQAFDVVRWSLLARPMIVKPGALITLGLDGSQLHDSTALVATDVESGFQWMPGLWECPTSPELAKGWQVPVEEVDACVRKLFADYSVWRMYADPPYWQPWIALWQGLYTKERVQDWWTNREKPMTFALDNYTSAIQKGIIAHDGDKRLTRHLGNSRRKNLNKFDEQGKPLWIIQKERHDSPLKIDAAMASVLSWEARTDAIASGAKKPEYQFLVFSPGGKR